MLESPFPPFDEQPPYTPRVEIVQCILRRMHICTLHMVGMSLHDVATHLHLPFEVCEAHWLEFLTDYDKRFPGLRERHIEGRIKLDAMIETFEAMAEESGQAPALLTYFKTLRSGMLNFE